MGNKQLRSGITTVLIANILNLGFSILTSFFLPKYLSVETYASIKTFQLYIGYVGLLHLGYVDGMYIKNGGKNLDELSDKKLSTSLSTLRVAELLISVLLVLVAVFLRDRVFLAFTMAIIPLNMTAYFQYMYSAVGEFKKYSSIVRLTTIGTFIANMALLFLVRTDNDIFYLLAYVVVDYCIWITLELSIRKSRHINFFAGFDAKEFIENIKNGILLTLGNLSSFLFTGMDRWFVKILLSTTDFAQYSFAVSIEHFVNVAMTPVSVTLYNYFCKEIDNSKIKKMRSYVTIFAVAVVAVGFPAKFILEHYLQTYISANSIIFLLFSAQIFYFPIKCIYVNLYKARQRQRQYFIKLIVAIIAGFLFNAVCFIVLGNKEAMAVGTVLSAVLWWLLCIPDFKEIPYKAGELIYMFLELIAFNICGICFGSIIGLLIYVGFTIILTMLLQRREALELIGVGLSMIRSRLKMR